MKLAAVLLSAACVGSVAASPSWVPSQVKMTEDRKVPGDNPLYFCEGTNTDDWILDIENVDLDPNPPQPGQILSIKAKGDIKKKIEDGAKAHLTVKYGLITLINQDADLCETVTNVDLKCPLEKGELNLTKDVELPKQIPPGKYYVKADVFTKDKDTITCLEAHIEFKR
ncbi:ML domain-containing protein [Dendryphion nanum]|uniref:Phosphatidylglycerol/phosphatidylinositol transfer protein n=1 Tax=Dendryphion nanum TaxID=256645 RepID=A0A9P9DI18_9PLEO|nr:ML domain-containing protein [Dendryphion nanum]